jgi:hypothetical protein
VYSVCVTPGPGESIGHADARSRTVTDLSIEAARTRLVRMAGAAHRAPEVANAFREGRLTA